MERPEFQSTSVHTYACKYTAEIQAEISLKRRVNATQLSTMMYCLLQSKNAQPRLLAEEDEIRGASPFCLNINDAHQHAPSKVPLHS